VLAGVIPYSVKAAMNTEGSQSGDSPFWRAMLTGEHPELRRGRRIFRFISPTATARCRLCLAAFNGFAAPLMRVMGRRPWRRNPHFCEKCEAVLSEHRGGAEIEIAVLYADVRGSTPLASRVGPAKFAALMQRFFQVATRVFARTDGMVDKMVGDEVIGLYLPGLTDAAYRQRAARAGLELLRATGHDDPGGPWLPIGVGVHAGRAFVGSIGDEGGAYVLAALGDPMNFGARLVGSAGVGEIVMSDDIWNQVGNDVASEPRRIALKGYPEPVTTHVTRIDSA
jgi:adenylate cyclase